MELHDRRTYYRAFQSHDARFDGLRADVRFTQLLDRMDFKR